MMRAEQLTIGYGGCALLEPLTLHFAPGEFVAVVGPNGAGKTTLLKTLAGLQAPLHGSIVLNAAPLTRMHARERARRLAFVDSETPVFGSLSVYDIVSLGRLPHRPWWRWTRGVSDLAEIDRALDACGLQTFRNREFRLLSSGERQRVWIAAAFAQAVPALLLDEPTSRLDIRYAIEVLELLRATARRGTTVIASMHDLERAALFADRVLVIANGKLLAAGSPAAALTEEVLELAYGIPIDVRSDGRRIWLAPRI